MSVYLQILNVVWDIPVYFTTVYLLFWTMNSINFILFWWKGDDFAPLKVFACVCHFLGVNWTLTRHWGHNMHNSTVYLVTGVWSIHQLCVKICGWGNLQFQLCPLDVTNITMTIQVAFGRKKKHHVWHECFMLLAYQLMHTCTHMTFIMCVLDWRVVISGRRDGAVSMKPMETLLRGPQRLGMKPGNNIASVPSVA